MAAAACRRGHPWTEENTYVRPRTGVRECRTCHRERMAREYNGDYTPTRSVIEELNDAAWLRERYVERRLTIRAIAEQLGCIPKTVSFAMRRHCIAVRPEARR